MKEEEIIFICDLYSQGFSEFQKIVSGNTSIYVKERDEMLTAERREENGGYKYAHEWIKKYVIDKTFKE